MIMTLSDFGGGTDRTVAENTAAIATALNPAAYRGETVHLPAGEFAINNPVWVTARNDGPTSPTLIGAGMGATVLKLLNPSEPGFQIGGGIGQHPVRWAGLRDLQIIYGGLANVDTPMIVLRNVKGFTVRDVWLRQYRTATQIGNNADGLAASCEDIHLDNVKMDPAGESFHGGHPVAKAAIKVENVNGLWFNGCSISGAHSQIGLHFTCAGQTTVDTVHVGGGTLIKDCLTAVRAGQGTASNVLFSGAIFDKCQSVAVHLETAPGCDLTNWEFASCWVNSAQYGYIVDDQAGQITRCRVTGGIIDHAPIPFTVQGSPDFVRTGI